MKTANENIKSSLYEPIAFEGEPCLTLCLWGDPQVSFISPKREKRLRLACEDLCKTERPLDALIIAGDVTEYGFLCEFNTVKKVLKTCGDKFGTFLCVPGNHDVRLRPYMKQTWRFYDFVKGVKPCSPAGMGKYYSSVEINGYKFILLGTDSSTFEGAYISKSQLNRLDRELSDASAGEKPVFVINHQTLKKHNGLPDTWIGKGNWRGSVGFPSKKLEKIFNKHGNVFLITGHLHFGVNKFSFEDRGKYKCLSLPTLGVNNHGDNDTPAQGCIMGVYRDKIVIRGRYFGEGRFMGEETDNGIMEIKLPL